MAKFGGIDPAHFEVKNDTNLPLPSQGARMFKLA